MPILQGIVSDVLNHDLPQPLQPVGERPAANLAGPSAA